ncbi:MAG TPA: DUF5995 family protein [Solirubrobacterales bacterium]|nr:DUF5995 family protein [Solirubrobacterales bacterium]
MRTSTTETSNADPYRGYRWTFALLAALVAALFMAPRASAQLEDDPIKWPQVLPPLPTTTEVQPGPVRRCGHASVECVERLVQRLREQWRAFDATCDHRAVISYSYLQITKGLRDDLAEQRKGLVKDRRWMTYVIIDFSNMYLKAFADDATGGRLADAWSLTFESADEGDANAGQDVLMFSNAHVQHDLPFVYEKMGLRARNGNSHKPDHDAVNAINAAVFDPIEKYIAAHYDPLFQTFDLAVPIEEMGVIEMIKAWREGAWRNGERLLNAETKADRREVVDSIRQTSALWAGLISSGGLPGTRESRDAYCLAQQG